MIATKFDWTAEKVEQLRHLWGEGMSTAAIGRAVGVGKNAVIGKSHRLELPPRPSPIRRRPPVVAAPPPPPRQEAATKPGAILMAKGSRSAFTRPAPSCQWPLGQPGTPGFRHCC